MIILAIPAQKYKFRFPSYKYDLREAMGQQTTPEYLASIVFSYCLHRRTNLIHHLNYLFSYQYNSDGCATLILHQYMEGHLGSLKIH